MTFRTLIPIILLCTVVILPGCGGPPRPADMPPLYPCTITVTQDGKPLSAASVTLVSTAPSFKWVVAAPLDESGTGKVFTQGLFSGAPAGEYKIVISKEEIVTEQVGQAVVRQGEFGEETIAPNTLKVFSLVEKDYTNADTTPLSITIAKKGNDKKFECGKPVREFLHQVAP